VSVSLVGSAGTARSTSASVIGAYGQSPTAGSLLVAVITGACTTATTMAVTGATGWTHLLPSAIRNTTNSGSSGQAMTDVWYKVAAGGDAAPTFSASLSGTVAMTCTIFELSGALSGGNPLDTSGSYSSSGSGTGTATVTFTATTGASVAASGEFGISAFCQARSSSGTTTWTDSGSGWTLAYDDVLTASDHHTAVNYQAGPASGSALSDGGHFFSNSLAYGAGVVLTISPLASVAGAASLSGTGTMTAAGDFAGAAALSGTGTLSAAVTQQPGASLSGTGTLVTAGLVTGPVLNANSDFETGITPWGPFPYGTTAQSAVWALHGTHSLLFTPDGVHSSGVWGESGSIAVVPGETVMFTVACYCPAGWTGSGNGVQAVLWWNTSGGSGGTLMPLTAGVVTFATVTAVVPAGVSFVQPEIAVQGIPPSSTLFYFDLAQVFEVYGSSGTWYPVAELSGSGSLGAAEVQQPGVSLSGAGALSAAVTQRPGASLSGTGALASAVVQQPAASLSGTGTMTAGGVLAGAASLSGTGTMSAAVAQQPGAALSGSGVLAAGVTCLVTAALSGTGTLSAAVTQQPGAAMSGTGSLSTAVTQRPGVSLSGSGALSAATGGAVAFLSGSGTLTAGATLVPSPVSLAGAGTLTAGPGWAGTAALSGSGTLSTAVRQLPGASLSGAGSLGAAVTQGPGAALSGAGALSAAIAVLATAALSGTGALSAGATRQPVVALSGTGVLSAAPLVAWLATAALSGTGVLTAAVLVAVLVRDADACHGEDSGFTFITSADTCSASEAGGPVVLSADTCSASEAELSRWVTDTDVCAAADLGWRNPHTDAETCSASDGGEVIYLSDSGTYPGGDSCIATDSYGGVIDVYTFIPPLSTGPGGGFEVVWTDQAGRRHLVLAGSHVSKAVLELAKGIAEATEVVFIRDSDGCRAAEASKPVIGVTVDVQPAVRVGIEAVPVSSRRYLML